jgi:hypothetical protein
MPAQIASIGRMQTVGMNHHRHGVPAHVGAQPLLDLNIARAAHLVVGGNGVDVGGVGREGHVHAVLPRFGDQRFEDEMRPLRAFGGDQRVQRIQPLSGFLGIGISRGGGK